MLLKEGACGDVVVELQRMLIALGYNVGNAKDDGIFGANTEMAVKAFQRDNNLYPDGIVGPLTWEVLDNKTATTPCTGSGEYTTYTVKRGDTLWYLAREYSTTTEAIMALNQKHEVSQ